MADAWGVTASASWLADYDRLLSEAGARLIHYLWFGDSIEEGYNASNRWETAHHALVRDHMQPKHGDGGSGFLSFVEAPSASAAPPDQIVEVGAWVAFIGALGTQLAGDAFEGLIIPKVRGETVRLWWQPATGFSPVLSVVDDDQRRTSIQVPSLPPKPEVLRLGPDAPRDVLLFLEAGAGNFLTGVEGLNKTGLAFHNLSHFGAASAYVNAPGFIGGTDPNLVGKYIFLRHFHRPDVLIYGLMVDDWGLGVPPATYEANMRTALNLARQRNPECLIVVAINHPGTGALGTWEQYRTRAYTVAADYDAAVVDLWLRSGMSQVAPWSVGQYFADAVHPSDLGHAWYAESFVRLLDRVPVGTLAA